MTAMGSIGGAVRFRLRSIPLHLRRRTGELWTNTPFNFHRWRNTATGAASTAVRTSVATPTIRSGNGSGPRASKSIWPSARRTFPSGSQSPSRSKARSRGATASTPQTFLTFQVHTGIATSEMLGVFLDLWKNTCFIQFHEVQAQMFEQGADAEVVDGKMAAVGS